MSSDRPVLLIDALNLFTRHFVANPTMSAHGHHVGGTIGFLRGIQLLVEKVKPKAVLVAWEGGGSSRRRTIYPDYKKGRKPQKLNRFYGDDIPDTFENRDYQISLIIELLKSVPVVQTYVSDCEADDVIAYAAKYMYKDDRCVIVSSDKDFYQLLSNRIVQWSPGQKRFVTYKTVLEKFGISSENFCTARCFCGDPSDGLPGIKGAGFKTMAKRFPALATDEFVPVSDIINESKLLLSSSKLKLYREITGASSVAERNWKLMYLDSSCLSSSQIQKIRGSVDTFEPVRDKISLMRILVREGVTTFDADSFFMSMSLLA